MVPPFHPDWVGEVLQTSFSEGEIILGGKGRFGVRREEVGGAGGEAAAAGSEGGQGSPQPTLSTFPQHFGSCFLLPPGQKLGFGSAWEGLGMRIFGAEPPAWTSSVNPSRGVSQPAVLSQFLGFFFFLGIPA